MTIKIATLTTMIVVASLSAHAQEGCSQYPYTSGMNIEDVANGVKIISTASVSVSFDDIDALNDARDEATLEAKAAIAKFMQEQIKSDQSIAKAVSETKSMQGDSKAVLRTETVQRVKALQNSAQALLRGVVALSECYTKGREFRVSVGIKPETVGQAEKLSGGISSSINRSNNGTGASGGSQGTGGGGAPKQGLQGIDSYSNTERLNKF